MHAIRIHAFGPPSSLVLDELPDLEPGPGQVRIAVGASGVHLVDTTMRRGEPGPTPRPELPTIPGREVAGVVDQVGREVDRSWLGRRVAAHLGLVPGGYADQALTTPERLHALPDHVDLPHAVAMVGTGRTARAILELGPPRHDDTVLVPSATGGLGWLLVQAALAVGARVVGAVGGPDKLARLRSLGPTVALDYSRPDWQHELRDLDVSVVYDGVGGPVGRAALESLVPGGRLLMFGHSSGSPTPFDQDDVVGRGLDVQWILGPRMSSLPGGFTGLVGRALDGLVDGSWSPLVTTYPLAEAAGAHADLEARATVGKVVLTSDGGTTTKV